MSETANRSALGGAIKVRTFLFSVLRWLVIGLMALLTLDVLWGVISRYVFGQQAKWSEELARMLLVWLSLFGASMAFAMKVHLGLDYFAGKLHPATQRFNKIVGIGICLAFAISVFIIGGIELVNNTASSGQTMVALPFAKWWEYVAVPASGVFMVAFLLEQLVEVLASPKDAEEKDPS